MRDESAEDYKKRIAREYEAFIESRDFTNQRNQILDEAIEAVRLQDTGMNNFDVQRSIEIIENLKDKL